MRFITFLYILLFVYIVAALVFWGISLQKQSIVISEYEKSALVAKMDSTESPGAYKQAIDAVIDRENRRKSQYLGEGLTFLLIIFIGSAVVYSSIRKSYKLNKQQKNFMLSITHELKSPIAGVKLNLQTIEKHRNLDEKTKSILIERSINEANRLDDLCNNLLLASQIESRHFSAAEESINLSDVVKECVEPFMTRGKNNFNLQLCSQANINGDSFLWKLVVNNLIENAIKYSPSPAFITIKTELNDQHVVLSVEDKGQGIPEDEKQRIFKKFYRVGNENARKTKGTGLGLFLTSHIVKQHKGAIAVRNNQPQGTIFEISVDAIV